MTHKQYDTLYRNAKELFASNPDYEMEFGPVPGWFDFAGWSMDVYSKIRNRKV